MKQRTAAQINAMPKTARPINIDLKTDIAKKYVDRIRHGKTAKDHGKRKPK